MMYLKMLLLDFEGHVSIYLDTLGNIIFSIREIFDRPSLVLFNGNFLKSQDFVEFKNLFDLEYFGD